MIIAIPTDEESMKSNVCISFGRTPYFLIYDTDTRDYVFIDNKASSSQGGAGIKAAQLLVDNKIDALITPRCGENAADVIKVANIQMYKTINNSIYDNIEAFSYGKLLMLEETHAGFHHHGGK